MKLLLKHKIIVSISIVFIVVISTVCVLYMLKYKIPTNSENSKISNKITTNNDPSDTKKSSDTDLENNTTNNPNSHSSQDDGIIVFSDDFEGSLNSVWTREMANNIYSGTFSTNYSISGTRSLRIELRNTDQDINNSKRSEIAILKAEPPNEERIYQFSTLLPSGGEEDFAFDPEGSEIIAQWHNSPDEGEEWTYPPLALHTFKGQYYLSRAWDDAKITTDQQMESKGNLAKHDLGSYLEDKGKFVTWKFHIKWGWLTSQHPFIEVYKNDVKLLELKDMPNTTNDDSGVHFKLGIYKWDWAQGKANTSILTRRIIYFDNVIISKIN